MVYKDSVLLATKRYAVFFFGRIAVDVADSDLDIVMEVHDGETFKELVTSLYSHFKNFCWKEIQIGCLPVYKANFRYEGFEFELFGQPVPVKEPSYAREEALLRHDPDLRERIIRLRSKGIKTEPAFAQLLGLQGDRYEAILDLGKALELFK
jgi:hypothetical protein